MSDSFSQQVLDKIEHENVHPLPRWVVLLQRMITWGIAIVSILFAALLCALLVVAVQQIDYDVIHAARPGPALLFLAQYVPILWIVMLIVFYFFILFILYRETHAYRYRAVLVAGVVGLGVLFLGTCIQLLSISDQVERYAERGFSSGTRPWVMRGRVFPRPEEGILVGHITGLFDDHFAVERLPAEIWNVSFDLDDVQLSLFHAGDDVIVRGGIIRPGFFHAEWIRLRSQTRGKRMMRNAQ